MGRLIGQPAQVVYLSIKALILRLLSSQMGSFRLALLAFLGVVVGYHKGEFPGADVFPDDPPPASSAAGVVASASVSSLPTHCVTPCELPRFGFSCCPASIAASRCRSSGESLPSSAASRASGSPWSVPSLSLLWSALRLPSACGDVASEAASRVPALSFSGSLVQTLVQTGEGVGVSALLLSLATAALLLPKLVVAGSIPVSRSFVS